MGGDPYDEFFMQLKEIEDEFFMQLKDLNDKYGIEKKVTADWLVDHIYEFIPIVLMRFYNLNKKECLEVMNEFRDQSIQKFKDGYLK